MKYSMCARTDPGQMRNNNEDAVAFDAAVGLCVLADGLGGHNAGEVASRLATAMVQSRMTHWLQTEGERAAAGAVAAELQACVAEVHQELLRQSRDQPRYGGMASTLVVGVFHGPVLVLGHAGDSRCYRWRDGVLSQLTRDHSFVQEQIDAGRMTPEEAMASGGRNLVTRALGGGKRQDLELHEHKVQDRDLYLLCSDGLTDMLGDAELAGILARSTGLEQCAKTLVDMANSLGGHDNISVLLVRVEVA